MRFAEAQCQFANEDRGRGIGCHLAGWWRCAIRQPIALREHVVLVEAPAVTGQERGAKPRTGDRNLSDFEGHRRMAGVECPMELAVAVRTRMRSMDADAQEPTAATTAARRPVVTRLAV